MNVEDRGRRSASTEAKQKETTGCLGGLFGLVVAILFAFAKLNVLTHGWLGHSVSSQVEEYGRVHNPKEAIADLEKSALTLAKFQACCQQTGLRFLAGVDDDVEKTREAFEKFRGEIEHVASVSATAENKPALESLYLGARSLKDASTAIAELRRKYDDANRYGDKVALNSLDVQAVDAIRRFLGEADSFLSKFNELRRNR